MFSKFVVAALMMAAYVSCQTTPVPILKQINRVNDDGSYTYGFEAADGSFKVETRSAQGDVRGKYGYVDETGILKTVEYGAGAIGFEADGEHLPEQPISAPFNAKQRDADVAAFVPAAAPKRKQQTVAPVVTQQVAPVVQPAPAPARTSAPIISFNQFDVQTGQLISMSPQQVQPVAQRTQTIAQPLNVPAVPTQQFNDIDSTGTRRGFSFSFEAPVVEPTRRF